jgi:hypothetical protein
MPIDVVLGQLPRRLERQGRQLHVEYQPIGLPMTAILVVVTDATDEITRQRAEAGQRELLGIFAVTDAADPGGPWQPDEGLDGLVPRALDDAVVRGFLYANLLRPLVVRDGAIAHASGFLGPPAHLPAYLALLTRALVDRCTGLDPTLDLQIDLTRMPDDAGAVTAVLAAVNRELRAAGAAPAFRLGPAMHAAVAGRLPGAVALRA